MASKCFVVCVPVRGVEDAAPYKQFFQCIPNFACAIPATPYELNFHSFSNF